MNPRIGLRTTGMVVFGARIFSAVTGLVFAVMVGRQLTQQQFGLWEFVVTLVSISIYPVGLVSFWATRDVARGRMIGRTAYVLGFLLSLGGLAVYAGFTFFTHSDVSSAIAPFLMGAVLVPLSFWSGVTGSIVLGYRPVAGAYSLVCGEIVKIIVAYSELYVFKAGIIGVLLALNATFAVQSIIGSYLTRGSTQGKLDWEPARRWLRLWALPALTSLPGTLIISDTFFVALLFGTAVVGYYQPAYLVASVVGYSSALTTPLYPLLLRGSSGRTSATSLEYMLLFAIPMAVGGIVLARPILVMFGTTPPHDYITGSMGLQVLCLMFLFLSISGVLDQTLMGTEKADEETGANLRRLAGSNLVFVSVVNIAFAVTYLASMVLVLTFATSLGVSNSVRVALWASMQLVAVLLYLVVKAMRARKVASIMPSRGVFTYLGASAVMAVVVYLLSLFLNAGSNGIRYGTELAGLVGAGALVYFGTVYVLDKGFRDLFRAFLSLL